jgi:hypothetical protein
MNQALYANMNNKRKMKKKIKKKKKNKNKSPTYIEACQKSTRTN